MRIIISIFSLLLISGGGLSNGQEIAPAETKSPPSIEEQISLRVSKLATEEMRKRMSFMEIVIDDISRLCELDEDQQKKLTLAAKGASSRSMDRWHDQAVRYFKTRVNGADTETAQQILSDVGTLNFGSRNADREGEMESLWTDSLNSVLSNEQINRYQDVVAQREQARIDAFAQMAIASLDNHLRLTPDQKKQLNPIITNSANQYLNEIQRYWGDYLEKNMLMSLVNAADKSTLNKILTSNQFARLRTATSNLDHFWDQRRRDRQKRLEAEAKKQAAAAKPLTNAMEQIAANAELKVSNKAVIIEPETILDNNANIKINDIQIEKK